MTGLQIKMGTPVCSRKAQKRTDMYAAVVNRPDDDKCRIVFEDQSQGWRKVAMRACGI